MLSDKQTEFVLCVSSPDTPLLKSQQYWLAVGPSPHGKSQVANTGFQLTALGGSNSTVNTLYIFGNEFDLAHGSKTSYKVSDHLRSTAEGSDLLENLSWFNKSMARKLKK